jgi:hypothetical protein
MTVRAAVGSEVDRLPAQDVAAGGEPGDDAGDADGEARTGPDRYRGRRPLAKAFEARAVSDAWR